MMMILQTLTHPHPEMVTVHPRHSRFRHVFWQMKLFVFEVLKFEFLQCVLGQLAENCGQTRTDGEKYLDALEMAWQRLQAQASEINSANRITTAFSK